MRLVPWLVLGAVAVSCALPSNGEFARGVGADAGSSGTTSPTNDAGNVLLDDGGNVVPNEAGADGSTPSMSCSSDAFYCNDFSSGKVEDISPVVGVSSNGSLSIADGVLRAGLPALPGEGHFEAQVFKVISTTALKARIEVDVNAKGVDWPGDGNTTVLQLSLDTDSTRHAEEIYLGNTYMNVTSSISGDLVFDGTSRDFPRSTWVHMRLEADFTPHAGSFRLYWDGQLVASRASIDFTPLTNFQLRAVIGLARNNPPTPELDVQYDNLVITLL